tara:strand:- start:570 stop:2495 length:1926 start_codon:yes stop_codon:yes gene_type:complete
MPQQQFKGYSEDQMKRIASKLGHTGDLDTLDGYLQGNPNAMGKYNSLNDAVTKRYAEGGAVTNPTQSVTPEGIAFNKDSTVGDISLAQSLTPRLPTGGVATAVKTATSADQSVDSTGTQVTGTPTAAVTTGTTNESIASPTTSANTVGAVSTALPAVETSTAGTTAAKGTISDSSQVAASQQVGSSVADVTAAQGTATQVEGAPTRTLEGGELVNPVADAQKAAQFTEQITAAQADPSSKATVQGQLATLMTSFDEGKTPAWAAGAMRNVTAQMAARGIGSSSMAGQALIQQALESSLPIATADAQTYANFEVTNLNNRQQRAMLSAQQRATFMGQEFDQGFQSRVLNSNKISEIANMQFTAEQAIAMENATIANSMNLTNLSNRQATTMAEAASLAQLDIANLNNRQQAQVQNAQNFLDMDMANLSAEQQVTMFKAQSSVSTILSDVAAENASKQFNATSQNQTDQFFANLTSSVSQFNATQKNAMSQFNAGEGNALEKFNTEVQNQRQQFNAQNSMVINQSNAQWRRALATADTAAINRANEVNAKGILDISNVAYNNLWQEHRDEMDWAYKNADSEFERLTKLATNSINAAALVKAAEVEASAAQSSSLGSSIMGILTTNLTGTVLSSFAGTSATGGN